MEIESLLKYLLPEELFEYFKLVEVKESELNAISFYLEEKSVMPPEHREKLLVSHGFDQAVTIQDFPLLQKSAYLVVRRRRWKDKATGMIYSRTHPDWIQASTASFFSS